MVKVFTQTTGSRRQVMNGTAAHTSGGLTRKDLIKNKKGRIVSKAKKADGLNKSMNAWQVALRFEGFLQKKKKFKPIPKKGTAAYLRVRKQQLALMKNNTRLLAGARRLGRF